MNKKQRIVAILKREYDIAIEQHVKTHAEHMGIIAAANVWDDMNPHEFLENPYDINRASEKDMNARVYASQMKEAYDYAIQVFLE